MAQKINPLNFRVKKRLNWKNMSCVHNFNDYFTITNNFIKLNEISNKMTNNLNSNSNNTNMTKTSKKYNISFEFLNPSFFIYLVKMLSAQKRSMQSFYQYKLYYAKLLRSVLKTMLLSQPQLSFSIYDVLSQKKYNKFTQKRRPFSTLAPSLITNFSSAQISDRNITSMQKNNFSLNLRNKLIGLVSVMLTQLKYDIVGLKIICSGKWKKTNTGRKQKLFLKYGKIQSSNITNKILYHDISQRTKYGQCSIKIWIAHKI